MNEGQMLADLAKLNKLAAKRNINKTHLYGRFFEKHIDYFLASIYSQPTDDRVRELEKDAARYRWLRKGASDEVAVVCGLGAMDYGMSAVVYTYSEEIDGDDLDATIDQAIASMSGEQK